MSDLESVLSPGTPSPKTIIELRHSYIQRAKRNSSLTAGNGSAACTASAKTFGSEWGVGVGLHFEILRWLRWLALLLMLCAIPFLVVIGCSVFTDAAHKYDHDYGVKKYPFTELHSLTLAAIVDDTVDNGTLPYMNTFIANSWKGPMRKSSFLIWISLADAGAMLLFLLGLAALWYRLKRFAAVTDKATLEAADYTVLVRGLPPDADATQVGEHFSRYGEVMDVVLVTDLLSATLRHCGQAARLQQRRNMVLDASKVRGADKHVVLMDKLDKKLVDIAEDIRGLAERDQSVKAAFVTFNSENERRTCTAQCPSGWLGSLMQRRQDRFQHKHTFWVRQAAAPEDYKFEDLAVPEWQLFAREVLINLAMLVLVVLCAAAIAKLTDLSNRESSTIIWHKDRLVADTAAAMLLVANNNNSGSVALSPEASAALAAGDMFGGELMPQMEAFCVRQLNVSCGARLQSAHGGLVAMAYGGTPHWVNATMRLLYERSVEEELLCSVQTSRRSARCQLQGCLPCLCMGVSRAAADDSGGIGGGRIVAVSSANESDPEMVCGPYINHLDIRSWGIRLSISAVVAVLNVAIKWVLSVLVLAGRHWTHTARERSFALQCYVAMLINTVAVLLVTNCEALGKMARESGAGSWTRFFVRYGAYSDFTAGWYENVGLSIMILMIINVGSPLLNLLVEEMWLVARRCCVLYCIPWPLQSDYDTAWARPRFTLAQRVADLLLNASLALIFGSGMPLLYLILALYLGAAELADRWALTRLCCSAPRYNTGLMKLVIALLPWMAALHCAFGLWMHTYFRVHVSAGGGGLEEVSVLSAAVSSGRLNTGVSEVSALQHSSVWQRITQPNGLPLLLLLVGLVLWLLVGRFVLWRLLSCLGRAAARLCCLSRGRRLMRFQIRRDMELQLNTLPYAQALIERGLHGTPTYRLAAHPHYQQYFAASGLNRAVSVAALIMSAANGGERRRGVYTRLTTVPQRRGRLNSGVMPTFRVLSTPVMDRDSLAAAGGRRSLVAAGLDEGHGTLGAAAAAESGVILPPLPPRMSRLAKASAGQVVPRGEAAGRAGAPDVCELLLQQEEEQVRPAAAALDLSPGLLPSPRRQPQERSQFGESAAGHVAGHTATAVAVVSIVVPTAGPISRAAAQRAATAREAEAAPAASAAASATAEAADGGGAPDAEGEVASAAPAAAGDLRSRSRRRLELANEDAAGVEELRAASRAGSESRTGGAGRERTPAASPRVLIFESQGAVDQDAGGPAASGGGGSGSASPQVAVVMAESEDEMQELMAVAAITTGMETIRRPLPVRASVASAFAALAAAEAAAAGTPSGRGSTRSAASTPRIGGGASRA